jgi:iron complex outermembrane receptor protein
VLIDGRRSAPSNGGNAVDIASIPIEMVERVEVLRDGASSIYGSDAIAGVVNFILRRDYVGAETSVLVGEPTRSGGGLETKYTGLAGWGDIDRDRFNVTLGADYERTKQILGSSRSFATNLDVQHSLDRTSNTAFPANVQVPTATGSRVASPTFPNCSPSETTPFVANLCRFDNAPFDALQPESKLESVALNGRFKLNDAIEVYGQAMYTRNETRQTIQPVLINGAAQPGGSPYAIDLHNLYNSRYSQFPRLGVLLFGAVTPAALAVGAPANAYALLPITSPYYPTAFAAAQGIAGQPLPLLLRSFQTGPRTEKDVSQVSRFVAGFRGEVYGWDYDVGALYSKDKIYVNLTGGWTLTDQYINLLNTGVINPFGATTDPAALAAAQAAVYHGVYSISQNSIESVNAKASRDLISLPAGPLSFATGVEFRREMLNLNQSPESQNFLVSGFGAPGVPIDAGRNIASAYVEFNAPIVKGLEVDIAGRYDHYEGVGRTFDPKASIRWQPIDQLLFRAAIGNGFRAPTLTDLFLPAAKGITTNGQRDLVRCPVIVASTDCSNQFVTILGGNAALKPERSKTQSAGVVFEPTKDYSIGVDAFYVAVKDTIRAPFSVAQILANPVVLSSFIQRGAPDGNASGVGPITGIVQTNVNAGRTNVSGVDVDLRGRVYNTAADKLTLALDGTYFTRYDQQNLLDGSFSTAINNAAQGGIGIVLRYRHAAFATWDHGPFSLTFQHNYQVGYQDTNTALQPATTTPRRVGSYTTLDAQLAYTGIKNLKLAIGAKNLADRDPPYTNYGGGFIGGYDLSYADVRGRFIYASATYKLF